MKYNLDIDANSFIAGFIAAGVAFGISSPYWLIAVPFVMTSFEIKGMPYANLTYTSGEGWNLDKGRYS